MEKIIRGNTRLTSKYELNKILDIINAKPTDIFCDLGCGEGMLCIWASQRLRFAYGIENYRKNYSKSQENKRKYRRKNVRIIYKNYELIEKIPELKKCTIFFCTNGLNYDFYHELEKVLKSKRAFFVSQYFAPYPIMSKKHNDWYVMRTPFQKAKSEKEWIQHMLGKGKTMKDLLKYIRAFTDYKNKKEELYYVIDFFNWLSGKR